MRGAAQAYLRHGAACPLEQRKLVERGSIDSCGLEHARRRSMNCFVRLPNVNVAPTIQRAVAANPFRPDTMMSWTATVTSLRSQRDA